MAVARYACAAERSAARREMGVGGVDAIGDGCVRSVVLAPLGGRGVTVVCGQQSLNDQ